MTVIYMPNIAEIGFTIKLLILLYHNPISEYYYKINFVVLYILIAHAF